MKLDCPHCRANLNIADRLAGKTGKCPQCRQPIQIPEVLNSPPSGSVVSAGQLSDRRTPEQTADPLRADGVPRPKVRNALWDRVRHMGGVFRQRARPAIQPLEESGRKFGAAALVGIKESAKRTISEISRVVRFYQAQRLTLWNWLIVTMGWDHLRESFARSLVIPEAEFWEDTWELALPACCVVCGEETGEEPPQRLCRDLDNLCTTGWVLVAATVAIPFAGLFFGWIGLFLLAAVSLPAGVRLCTQRPVSVSFSVCTRHRKNTRYPELQIVNSGLMVSFGSPGAKSRIRQARRESQRLGHQPPTAYHPPSRRSAISGDAAELEATLPPATIALAETVEPTPIIHSRSPIYGTGAGQGETISLPAAVPGEPVLKTVESEPTPVSANTNHPTDEFIRLADDSPGDGESRDTSIARVTGPQTLSDSESESLAFDSPAANQTTDNAPADAPIQLSDDFEDVPGESAGLQRIPTAAAYPRRLDESEPPQVSAVPGAPTHDLIYLVDDDLGEDEIRNASTAGSEMAQPADSIEPSGGIDNENIDSGNRQNTPSAAVQLPCPEESDDRGTDVLSGIPEKSTPRKWIGKFTRLCIRIAVEAAALAAFLIAILAGYGYRFGASPEGPIERQLVNWLPQVVQPTILPPGHEAAMHWIQFCLRLPGRALAVGVGAVMGVVLVLELVRFSGRRSRMP